MGCALAAGLLACTPALGESFTYELFTIQSSPRTLITQGTKAYSREDTEVTEETGLGQKFLQKQLRLGNGYIVGLSDHRDALLDGLGCWLKRDPSPMEADPYPGFSWEWFNRTDGDVFAKLQGGGRIKVTTRTVSGAQLISRVEFLDDVTFRMSAKREALPGTHTHEMLIRRGSVLAFPLDIDDRGPKRVTLRKALTP